MLKTNPKIFPGIHIINFIRGRLLNIKSVAISTPPMVGGMAVFIVLGVGEVSANDECGTDASGLDTVLCTPSIYNDGITYTNSDGMVLDINNNGGIINNNGVKLSSNMSTSDSLTIIGSDVGTLNPSGVGDHGLYVHANNEAGRSPTHAQLDGGFINILDGDTYGVYAVNEGYGTASVQMDGGNLSLDGDNGYGIISQIDNTSNNSASTAILLSGNISTQGDKAWAIYAQSHGQGATIAQMDGGTVTASGLNSHGLISRIRAATNSSTATAMLTGGSVLINDASGYGVYAVTYGTGETIGQMDGGIVTTKARNGHGIVSRISSVGIPGSAGNTSVSRAILTAGTIETEGLAAYGMISQTDGTGATIAQMGGGQIKTNSNNSYAIQSLIDNASNNEVATASLTGGSVITEGSNSYGAYALTRGGGGSVVNMDGGTLNTAGDYGSGLVSRIYNTSNSEKAIAILESGSITLGGDRGYGVYALTSGTGDTLAQVDGGTLNTHGANSRAVVSQIGNSTSTATAEAVINGGSINTSGANALGVISQNIGLGDAKVIMSNGDIVTGNAHGIKVINSTSSSSYLVSLQGDSSVFGGGVASAGINTASYLESAGSIIIGENVTVGGGAGIIDGDGNTNMEIRGEVNNGIIAGSGDDTVSLFSTSVITENLSMGDGSDTLTVLSGANIAGITLLDGGDDALGFSDSLHLINQTLVKPGTFVNNWEKITIDGGSFEVTDGRIGSGVATGLGLFIENGGVFDSGHGLDVMGNIRASSGTHFIATGDGDGVYSVSGSVENDGSIITRDGFSGDTLSIAGDYAGSGTIALDINTDNNTADTINIGGNSSGDTVLFVSNLEPELATGEDITLITVSGSSNANDFSLSDEFLTAGVFDYGLHYNSGEFKLSPHMNATGETYSAVSSSLIGFSTVSSLENRTSQRIVTRKRLSRSPSISNAWLQMKFDKLKANMSNGEVLDQSTSSLAAGMDFEVMNNYKGNFLVGAYSKYGDMSSAITGMSGGGTIVANSLGLGLTATWFDENGFYADGQVYLNKINLDISSSAGGQLISDHSAHSKAVSIEVGRSYSLGDKSRLVPQAEMTFTSLDAGNFIDSAGTSVNLGKSDIVSGRIGLKYEFGSNKPVAGGFEGYIIGNITHQFSQTTNAQFSAISTNASIDDTWLEVGAGAISYLKYNGPSIYGNLSYKSSGSDNVGLQISGGLDFKF